MPRELKCAPVMVRLEPTLYDLLQQILNEEPDSNGGYMRGLLIRDLMTRGLLTESVAAAMMGATRKMRVMA